MNGQETRKTREDAESGGVIEEPLLAVAVARRLRRCFNRSKQQHAASNSPLFSPALPLTWAGDATARRAPVAMSAKAAAGERGMIAKEKKWERERKGRDGRQRFLQK